MRTSRSGLLSELDGFPLLDDYVRIGRPRDDVDKYANDGHKDDEEEPQGFGPATVIRSPKIVDEAPDHNEDPENEKKKFQDVPENREHRVTICQHQTLLSQSNEATTSDGRTRCSAHKGELGRGFSRAPVDATFIIRSLTESCD
jgi:hypothetical protein